MKETTPLQLLQEIENIMERWNLGRDNDDETLEAINQLLKDNDMLKFFNDKNKTK